MAVNNQPPITLDPSQDQGHQLTFINQNFQQLANSLNPYQLSDGSNNILSIGKDSTGAYSVKIAKPGFNAYDAVNSNLVFNSSQNVFKIVQSGTVTLPGTTAGTTGTVAYNHNLGYYPIVLAYMAFAGSYLTLPYINLITSGANDGKVASIIHWATDTSTVTFYWDVATFTSNTSSVSIKLYLLQESAN